MSCSLRHQRAAWQGTLPRICASARCFTNSLDDTAGEQGRGCRRHLHARPSSCRARHQIVARRQTRHLHQAFFERFVAGKGGSGRATESGKHVFVGQSSRFFAPFTRQREHFQTGAFGELNTIEAAYHADHRWFLEKPWAKQSTFKWLYGGLSHPADLARWYLPDIAEVMGYSSLSENGQRRRIEK